MRDDPESPSSSWLEAEKVETRDPELVHLLLTDTLSLQQLQRPPVPLKEQRSKVRRKDALSSCRVEDKCWDTNTCWIRGYHQAHRIH